MAPPTESTVPAVIDYLVGSGWGEGVLPPGVAIYDGDPRVYVAPGYVAITGWRQQQDPESLGGPSGRFALKEEFHLEVVVRAWQGDVDQAAARSNAFAIYNAIQDAVRADATLGGNVLFSWVASQDAKQGPTDKGGVACEIAVELYCQARII